MNPRKSFLTLLTSGSLLFAGTLLAQNQPTQPPMPPPAPTAPTTMPAPQPQAMPQPQAAPAPQPGQDSTKFNSAQGQVTVNSSMPAIKDAGPPPDFATLANGKAYITEDDAAAYPPLANDFLHASGGNKHLSKAAYARWLKQR